MDSTKTVNYLRASEISRESSLREAMLSLEQSTTGIVLVVDAQRRLLGVLTDGDIRRALLKGAVLEAGASAYMWRSFTSVDPSLGRADVLDLMRARTLHQVPIVNAQGKVVGLHLLKELVGAAERSNWAVIMAGGKGTRLGPITKHLPKPMLKVAGRPILERIVLHLVGHGIRRVYLAINYMGDVIESHFGNGERFGCRIDYLRENEPLGTGGPLSLLPEAPAEPLLVLNGDLVMQVDVDAMLSFHTAGQYQATIGVHQYYHEVPFGCVELDGSRILRMEEKPVLGKIINAGIYVLEPELLKHVPRRFFPITTLLEESLQRGERQGAFMIEDEWIDVGRQDELRRAQKGS